MHNFYKFLGFKWMCLKNLGQVIISYHTYFVVLPLFGSEKVKRTRRTQFLIFFFFKIAVWRCYPEYRTSFADIMKLGRFVQRRLEDRNQEWLQILWCTGWKGKYLQLFFLSPAGALYSNTQISNLVQGGMPLHICFGYH